MRHESEPIRAQIKAKAIKFVPYTIGTAVLIGAAAAIGCNAESAPRQPVNNNTKIDLYDRNQDTVLSMSDYALALEDIDKECDALCADVNGTGVVDADDVELTREVAGTQRGDGFYNFHRDTNGDEKNDCDDVNYVKDHLGQTVEIKEIDGIAVEDLWFGVDPTTRETVGIIEPNVPSTPIEDCE